VGCIEYHNNLYGDAARGCHHRGDGPDARERTISISRQRLGILIHKGPRRNPWGCRGGACGSDPFHVSPPRKVQWNLGSTSLREGGKTKMAAKKKAAKKPAAKKKAAKKK